jgi:hypothetical protein
MNGPNHRKVEETFHFNKNTLYQRTRPSPPAVVARKSEEEHLRSNKFLRRTRDVSPIMEVYDIVASLLFTHLKGVKWCVFFFAATGLVLTVKWFWH